MTTLTTEWHPWFSYEWWSQIGTGLLSFTAAAIIGSISATVAVISVVLTHRARRDARLQADEARRDRYRDQLIRVIEPAITALVDYGNEVNSTEQTESEAELRLRAAAIARLHLVKAVVDEEADPVVLEIRRVFRKASVHESWYVRVNVAGRLAGLLALVISQKFTLERINEEAKRSIAKVEKDERERNDARETAAEEPAEPVEA